MKKIIVLFIALLLPLNGIAVLAENGTQSAGVPLFETIGQAMEDPGYTGISGGDGQHCIVVLTAGEKLIRVVADLDEESGTLFQAIFDADLDGMEAAQEAYDEHLKTLPVSYTEEITLQPKDQAELDRLTGKTLQEVWDAGYQEESIGGDGINAAVCSVSDGFYLYDLLLNEGYDVYEDYSENGREGELTVKSAAYAGVSRFAAELRFHADGTVEPEQDPFEDFNNLWQTIADALEEAKISGQVNQEALIQQLAELMPEVEEENVRTMVELLSMIPSVEEIEAEIEAEEE